MNDAESSFEIVEAMGGATHVVDLKYFALGFTVFLKSVSGSGTVSVEISPDGVEWFVPANAVIPAKASGLIEGDNAAHFSTWARHLRFTWSGITACTLHIVARKSAR